MDFNQSIVLLIAGLYYIITGIFVFFGVFSVYILLRYGRTRLFSLIFSAAFVLFFLTTLTISFSTLQQLQQAVTSI